MNANLAKSPSRTLTGSLEHQGGGCPLACPSFRRCYRVLNPYRKPGPRLRTNLAVRRTTYQTSFRVLRVSRLSPIIWGAPDALTKDPNRLLRGRRQPPQKATCRISPPGLENAVALIATHSFAEIRFFRRYEISELRKIALQQKLGSIRGKMATEQLVARVKLHIPQKLTM